MYPKFIIDTKKLAHNVHLLKSTCNDKGIDLAVVTKGFSCIPEVSEVIANCGVKYLADSRIENLKGIKGIKTEKMLLRLPMISQVDEVVKYSDISLNSELSTINALNEAARKQDKTHKIVLMIDVGDLREGIFFKDDILGHINQILKHENIDLLGLGFNVTCYGAVIAKPEHMEILLDIKKQVKEKFDFDISMIQGGNSSSVYLLLDDNIPKGVNALRVGEAVLLGQETAYQRKLEGYHLDVFKLQTELIEVQNKPSYPIGERGKDAFGNEPSFEDIGNIVRGIVAIGKQDVAPDALFPIDENIKIISASSDHLLLDLTDTCYKVGDIIEFDIEYGSLLSLSTSKYVSKEIK